MTTETRAPVSVFVPGRPRPKGSLKRMPAGGVTESNPHTRDWRRAVADAVGGLIGWGERGYGDAAVEVRAIFLFERGLAKTPAPTTRFSSGDLDKLLRCVLDALQDARLISDDSQVVSIQAEKAFAGPADEAGVMLIVTPIPVD